MKTISVREMKAQSATVEAQVRDGETFEVLNRARPAALIVPAAPRRILKWDDHLATALPVGGRSTAEALREERETLRRDQDSWGFLTAQFWVGHASPTTLLF